MQKAGCTVKVGEFVFDKEGGFVQNGEQSIKLEPLSHAFLCLLLTHKNEVVSREQMLEHVWKGRQVTDDSIRRVVKKLRDAFSDNAKHPRYIKTVSMQGYSLIAAVSDNTSEHKHLQKRAARTSVAAIGSISVLLVCVIFLMLTLINGSEHEAEHSALTSTSPLVTRLTEQRGAEVNGDYNPLNDQLVYSNRTNDNDAYQLYSKHLASGEIKQLTFDGANYHKALWSPDGKQLVFQKTLDNQTSIWFADYHAEQGLVNAAPIVTDESPQKLLGWSSAQDAIYIARSSSDSIMQSVYRHNITEQITHQPSEQMTFPAVIGYGDYAARESQDGSKLAILRNVSERRYQLIVLDLDTQSLLAQKTLGFFATSIIWHPNHEKLALTSFKGDFYYYDLNSDQLVEQQGSRPGLNDAFYFCGEGCYFMQQHVMNYTDIAEEPMPFSPYSSEPLKLLESPKAEFNAIYNHSGDALYFTQKDEHQGQLCKRTNTNLCQMLLEFNPRHILNHLALNLSETRLTGKLENRIFILDLNTLRLKYVTSDIDYVSIPTWEDDDTLLFSRQEQNQFVQMRYSVPRDKLSQGQNGVFLQRNLADGRIFWSDAAGVVYQKTLQGIDKFIGQLPIPQHTNWHVLGDNLFYTHYLASNVAMTKISMEDGMQSTQIIAPNASSLHFSLHSSGQKMLITKELVADGDLVKVEWGTP